MKIRAIEVTNLRRFGAQRARLDGIGDGISILSQPNEFGKSTFFDGLHALFFQPHRSRTAQTRALQPHAGGAPEAAVEVELPEGRFRLEKRWLTRQTARVLDSSGRVIAQEDEAEAWIDRLTGQGLAGPSGLLWVRQGLLGMETEGTSASDRAERDRGFSTRRDLVSSVAGEIEVMTGGRRMDKVLSQASEAIARLATGTLRPKAGGEWARAVDEATTLQTQRVGLEDKAKRLTDALSQRAALVRTLLALSDPESQVRDKAALSAAEATLKAAESHAEQTRKAASDLRLAQLSASQSASEIRRIEHLKARLSQTMLAHGQAAEALSRAEGLVAIAMQAERAATDQHRKAQKDTCSVVDRLERAQRAHLAQAARDRAVMLAAQLARAEQQRTHLENQIAARAVLKVTPALLDAAERAQAVVDRLSAQDEARQVAVTFDYHGDARVLSDGRPLGAEGARLRGRTRLDLPGIGQMTIDPGLGVGDGLVEKLARAQGELATALVACDVPDLAAARRAFAEAQRLDNASAAARAMLVELADGGIDALRLRLATAQAEAGEADDTPPDDLTALATMLQAAQETERSADALRREAEVRHATLREARAGALAGHQAADQALVAIRAEVGDPVELSARLLNLTEAHAGLVVAEQTAETALTLLQDDAPDLATAQAAVMRLRSVLEGRKNDRAQCETALAGVNGSIGALADEGIEEALDELRGREATAQARAARYEREVKSLALLRDALEVARRAAREAYFGPVLRELSPLLSILHPGAELQIDDTSLLPMALTRDGQSEGLDILSGGTREQLAVLTRLAFARLFAAAGRPVPVILDDALVHSDDDRIEAMFTALHRVAQSQQIIVFTCRQRAFAPLGGERINLTIAPV
ncbi:MAG: chromosome segregation protein SMC [Paracoccaceae bacterium]